MQLAILGLGRMGFNMLSRLIQGGHELVAFNRSPAPLERAAAEGADPAPTLREVAAKLSSPRICWTMLPAGDVTEQFITALTEFLEPGDIIIDGGNSYYKDTVRRGDRLVQQGFKFVDVGTSGGIWGLTEGYSLMIGGETDTVEYLRPIFETLAPAPDKGWGHVGPHGAGHFTKMVHNGIEYGMMQAFAEGFALMGSKTDFHLDLRQIAEIWRHGSVVRSWLLDLTARALAENSSLEGIAPYVPDSGEGRWTVLESVEQGVPLPVIALSLAMRFRSQDDSPFADKLLAVMREQFGGHAVKREE
ncbi:MAG: 6-phosphogluconate dehydrogenase, decarboxylating [bacterium ADurb.Bin429]|nr:MAG: 6-phosphogluconate dehydrogenase, decarboxylating [bacterium ADurb.Bin429]